MAPSDAAEKNRHMVHNYIPLVQSQGYFAKFTSCMTFGGAVLLVQSHSWTTHEKFDNFCRRYIATCGKVYIGAHSWLLNVLASAVAVFLTDVRMQIGNGRQTIGVNITINTFQ